MKTECGCDVILNGSAFLRMHRDDCQYPALRENFDRLTSALQRIGEEFGFIPGPLEANVERKLRDQQATISRLTARIAELERK